MNLERRLREHFDVAGGHLSEPQPDPDGVVRRGQRRRTVQTAAVAAGTMAVAVVTVLGLQGLTRNNVEFAPAAPPATPTPTPTPRPTPRPTPSPTPSPFATPSAAPLNTPTPDRTESADAVEVVDPQLLGAPVIVYGAANPGLAVVDGDGVVRAGDKPVRAAFPDHRGGVVAQTRSGAAVWFPMDGSGERRVDVGDPAGGEEELDVTLRGVEPDGSVIFSTRPAKVYDDNVLERFFAVPLAGGTPQFLGEELGYESWYVGPVATVGGRVLASCHLLCSLWRWSEDGADEPLYDGGGRRKGANAAIDDITATPDGTLIALVESNEMISAIPQLVVLDAGTFDERLRLQLPVEKGTRSAGAVVSMSSDGQRILVSVDVPRRASNLVPRTTFLVDDALSQDPVVRRVDYPGVVRWLDPATVQRR